MPARILALDSLRVARCLAAEMHAGFSALRNHCPMNLRLSYTDCAPPSEVLADLARLELIWDWAREQTGAKIWLAGDYSAADAFFAPVATRLVTYGVALKGAAREYQQALLESPAVSAWSADAVKETEFVAEDELGRIYRLWIETLPGHGVVSGAARMIERQDDLGYGRTGHGFHHLRASANDAGAFSFDADHPEVFASEDHGATPVEFVLAASAPLKLKLPPLSAR